MVKIPEYKDPTLMAMYRAIEQKEDDSREGSKRKYLGASIIGNECARQIYYMYNHYQREPFKAETLMNFADGHRTEDLTAERLRMVQGVSLTTHGDDGYQLGFSALDGKFRGHYDGIIDGIIQAPKKRHIWEHKSSAEKKYNEFVKLKKKYGEKQTLINWNMNYYVQGQIYMHFERLDDHYMTVSYAGGRKYESCRTKYDGDVAVQYYNRAEKIINATSPPDRISNNSDFFICRWCDFSDECHKNN